MWECETKHVTYVINLTTTHYHSFKKVFQFNQTYCLSLFLCLSFGSQSVATWVVAMKVSLFNNANDSCVMVLKCYLVRFTGVLKGKPNSRSELFGRKILMTIRILGWEEKFRKISQLRTNMVVKTEPKPITLCNAKISPGGDIPICNFGPIHTFPSRNPQCSQ